MTLTAPAPALFPWRTIRKEAPYRGHAQRKDGAAKNACGHTTKACGSAKSMRVNRISFVLNLRVKLNILTAHFSVLTNCPVQDYFSRQLTPINTSHK